VKLCKIPGCGEEGHHRGWCDMHYARWRRHGDPFTVLRVRQVKTALSAGKYKPPKRVRFTPALWSKWLERLVPTERTEERRAGIQDMRARLDARDMTRSPLSRPTKS
jgi:hypothetical protein